LSLGWLRHYRMEWLRSDVLAGLSVCVVMIPSVIAYAGLMGLAPEHGLYAALVPLMLYPLLASSRQVIVGPDIAISLLVASAVGPLSGGSAVRAAGLAATLALLSGLILIVGARFKVGAVAEFFSKPVLAGYMAGAGLILIVSQLDKLFSISLTHGDFFPRLVELGQKLGQAHGKTLLFGLGLLGLQAGLKMLSPRWPAALTVCLVALAASYGLHLERHGVKLVGSVPAGMPAMAWPVTDWSDIHNLLPAALGIALLTYTEGVLLARAFAAKNGYEVNANQELAALGTANLGAGLFQGFSVTGSQARTTINDAAGGKTQLASLVAAVALVLFLLFLTPFIASLPQVALAAVLVWGGMSLVDFGVMKRMSRYYPRSAMLAAFTTLGVLAVGVVPGILLGVGLSLLGLINRISHPPDAVLREVSGHGFHDTGGGAFGETLPGLVVYRFYSPLLFPNASFFAERVRQLVASAPTPVRWLLIDAQAVTDIDVTAAEALQMLQRELRQQGIQLKVAHANLPLRAILEKTGLASEIRPESFYGSVHECVEEFRRRSGG
jgi:SulP family sulfate permease